jgi:hypothetical protein
MHSAATRSVTVVTILTLFFAPVMKGHHWKNVLVGKTTETQIVECQPNDPCPKHITITNSIYLPARP